MTLNNTQKLLAGVLALVFVAGMTSPAFAGTFAPIILCAPPISGDWIIVESCQLSSSTVVPGNVVVLNNSVLVIPNGITLDIDFANFNLTIESGSSVLIKCGGELPEGGQVIGDGEIIIEDCFAVAGELLPLDSTALMIAGLTSITVWMIPTVLGLAGVGVYLVKFRANRG